MKASLDSTTAPEVNRSERRFKKNLQAFDEEPRRSVVVRDLPFGCASKELRSFFSEYLGSAPIIAVVLRNPEGRTLHYGCALFDSEELAERAIETAHLKRFMGRDIRVLPYNNDSLREQSRSGDILISFIATSAMVAQITEENIRNIVEKFGEIAYIAIRSHKVSKEGKQSGFGFVTMKDPTLDAEILRSIKALEVDQVVYTSEESDFKRSSARIQQRNDSREEIDKNGSVGEESISATGPSTVGRGDDAGQCSKDEQSPKNGRQRSDSNGTGNGKKFGQPPKSSLNRSNDYGPPSWAPMPSSGSIPVQIRRNPSPGGEYAFSSNGGKEEAPHFVAYQQYPGAPGRIAPSFAPRYYANNYAHANDHSPSQQMRPEGSRPGPSDVAAPLLSTPSVPMYPTRTAPHTGYMASSRQQPVMMTSSPQEMHTSHPSLHVSPVNGQNHDSSARPQQSPMIGTQSYMIAAGTPYMTTQSGYSTPEMGTLSPQQQYIYRQPLPYQPQQPLVDFRPMVYQQSPVQVPFPPQSPQQYYYQHSPQGSATPPQPQVQFSPPQQYSTSPQLHHTMHRPGPPPVVYQTQTSRQPYHVASPRLNATHYMQLDPVQQSYTQHQSQYAQATSQSTQGHLNDQPPASQNN